MAEHQVGTTDTTETAPVVDEQEFRDYALDVQAMNQDAIDRRRLADTGDNWNAPPVRLTYQVQVPVETPAVELAPLPEGILALPNRFRMLEEDWFRYRENAARRGWWDATRLDNPRQKYFWFRQRPGGRDYFLANNAPQMPFDRPWHLHAFWDNRRGKVFWRISTRASRVCRVPGRCQIISVALRENK